MIPRGMKVILDSNGTPVQLIYGGTELPVASGSIDVQFPGDCAPEVRATLIATDLTIETRYGAEPIDVEAPKA